MEYWPVLETKSRKLILDLVEPTIRRVGDQKVLIDQLKISEDAFTHKLESHDTMLERINNRLSILDEYARRLMQFESDLRIYDIKSENERAKIKDAAELLTERVNKTEQNIEDLMGKAECLRIDGQIMGQNLNSTRATLSDTIETVRTEMLNGFSASDENRKNLELALLNTDKRVGTITKDLGEVDLLGKNTNRMAEETGENLERITEQVAIIKKEYKEQIEKIRALTLNYNRQSMEALKKLKDQIKVQVNNEQPVLNYAQIMEALYETFSDLPTKKKIAEAEAKLLPKFESMNIPESLKIKISEFALRSSELINTEIPKEKKKKKSKFKLSDLLSMDNKIKTHEQKMSMLEEKITTIEGSQSPSKHNLNDSSQSESDEVVSTLETLKQNSEVLAQIMGVKDYSGEISALKKLIEQCNLSLNDFSSQLLNVQNTFTTQLTDFTSQLQAEDEKIISTVSDLSEALNSDLEALSSKESEDISKVYSELSKNSEETAEKIAGIDKTLDKFIEDTAKNVSTIEFQVQQAVYECNSASTQRKRDHNDNHSEFMKIHQHADILTQAQDIHYKKIEILQGLVNRITEFLKIGVALQYQDEVDRESVALIGYKESKTGQKFGKTGTTATRASISLDKQCISCSGQVNMITSAFKIACLAYTPSLVNYKDSTFQRLDLLEIQRKMIYGLPEGNRDEVAIERPRNSKTPKPAWRPVSSLSMCIPSGTAQTPDLPPISLAKRINNYVN